jgi:hypothetical protein
MWTNRAGEDFFAIIACFINKGWEMEYFPIAFESPSKSHSGEHMGDLFIGVIKDYGLMDKISTITCDNASNNYYMGKRLEELGASMYCNSSLNDFKKVKSIVPCLNHVLNLSIQELLKNVLLSEAKQDQPIYELLESVEKDLKDKPSISENPINKLRHGIIKIR